jgi:SHS2 domain-containing protein
METGNIEPRESYAVAAEGDSRESLLVNWLSDVLFHLDGRRLALHSFKVHELNTNRVAGEAFGEPRDPYRHPGKLIVKGITYHQLKVGRDQVGWFCEVYLDI